MFGFHFKIITSVHKYSNCVCNVRGDIETDKTPRDRTMLVFIVNYLARSFCM